ncbi:N-acetyllactosaminide beta-1,3-N-acetylglucosaminyltransferase 3 [Podila clonocystis]|nr:N-acetyllactosaminide beta-1,3-N-acetylglucosaminyltransferase 3 [Podila clonocystis]
MGKDSFKAVATAAAVGLTCIAFHTIRQRKAKTGREPWNPTTDLTEYDYIIVGVSALLHEAHAKREVLLCAGAFHTPVLLLAFHESIPVVHSLPGEGQNLSNHSLQKAVYNFVRRGTGPLVSALAEGVTFHRLEDMAPEFFARKAAGTWQDLASRPNAPHIELMYSPCFFEASMEGAIPRDSYYAVIPVILNPASRGSVGAKLRPDSAKKGQEGLRFDPVIDPNIYSDPFDMRVMKEAIRFVRKLAKHMELDPGLGGKEWYPTEAVANNEDDEALEQVIRESSVTFFHAWERSVTLPLLWTIACGCMAWTDLRIIDTSVIPKVVACHTCAVAVMIAEKVADMIREDNTKTSSKEE